MMAVEIKTVWMFIVPIAITIVAVTLVTL